MNKIWDGLLYGVGATVAFHLVGFLLSLGLWVAYTLVNLLFSSNPGDFM